MGTDKLFSDKRDMAADFNFGQETANVFDDMLDRSVPYYQEIQRMIGELCADFAVPGTNVYDLGCSTCTTFVAIEKGLPPDVTCVGVDASAPMLEKARAKLKALQFPRPLELVQADMNQGVMVRNASVVILNLTLQFIRPLNREALIRSISSGINPGGCLILIEKVLSQNSTINRLFIKHYYEMKKRNGYSDMEISQKREALENVLIPYHYEENRDLLLRNQFTCCESFFRWYNFCGMVALK